MYSSGPRVLRPICALIALWCLTELCAAAEEAAKPFEILVIDDVTGRGVPMVELRTVDNVCYYTDSAGRVALDEPTLFGQSVFFYVRSHGYEFAKDGFGFAGKAIDIEPGGQASLKLKRLNIAERLYRVTGRDIYRDTIALGKPVPIMHRLINAQVIGCDSVVNAPYQGRMYWFWGDTNRLRYPLGNFAVTGATSLLPADGGLDPEQGIDLDYFVGDDGFAKKMAPVPGDGPTWIDGLVTIRDDGGRERLFAAYVKVRKFLEVYARGIVEYDDTKKQFEPARQFDMAAPLYPQGHAFAGTEVGVEYLYFGNPFPLVRVRRDIAAFKDPTQYEAFTCLAPGTSVKAARVERDASGLPRWGWKRNTPFLSPKDQAQLVRSGKLKPGHALLQLQDVESGAAVEAHAGSIAWNPFRARWTAIIEQAGGTSNLGEVWYADADTPLGPWVYARKVVTHDRYSFYNPKQHPLLAKEDGAVLFFEGTYSNFFAGNANQTPRYDYNQMMYKLDLRDSRLALPAPVYLAGSEPLAHQLQFGSRPGMNEPGDLSEGPTEVRKIAFFALDRPGEGSLAIFLQNGRLVEPGPGLLASAMPRFYALPADVANPPKTTTPLYEFVHAETGARAYSVDESWAGAGFKRSATPICRVWRSPYGMPFPTGAKPSK